VMFSFESILETLKTGSGFWNPLIWVIIAALAFLLIYVLRSFGKKEFKEKTEQTQSFLSGNPEYEKEQMRIKGSNVYWGFIETMKWALNILRKMHTGNASDYVLWLVIVMGFLFIVVFITGVL